MESAQCDGGNTPILTGFTIANAVLPKKEPPASVAPAKSDVLLINSRLEIRFPIIVSSSPEVKKQDNTLVVYSKLYVCSI
jgi:hypothetical protein